MLYNLFACTTSLGPCDLLTVKDKAFEHDDTGQRMIKGPITIKLTCDIRRPALTDNLLSPRLKAP